MQTFIRIGSMASLTVLLFGCGTLYKLDVTAYSNPNPELDRTYVILSGSSDLNVNSPEFEVYANQVERTIEPKGYRRLPGEDISSASLGLYLTIAVGDPGKRYHKVSQGVYERPIGEEVAGLVNSADSPGGPGGNSGSVVSTPRPEQLTGYDQKSFATTVYTKHLNLVAVDLRQYIADIKAYGRSAAIPKEIWSIDIETTGKPSDLNEVLPVMLAAAQPYVENSTDEVVRVKIGGTDKRITAIRGD
jgi:hypothetical protein